MFGDSLAQSVDPSTRPSQARTPGIWINDNRHLAQSVELPTAAGKYTGNTDKLPLGSMSTMHGSSSCMYISEGRDCAQAYSALVSVVAFSSTSCTPEYGLRLCSGAEAPSQWIVPLTSLSTTEITSSMEPMSWFVESRSLIVRND
jgi:hypothetical protein